MKIYANAKINLTLDVIGKREDGYHLIDSVFQSVSLYDEVTVEKNDDIIVCCTDTTIDNKSNIVYKAAQHFFKYTGIYGGVKITLKKNIPLASGMGGGSADAAAVIVALDKIYDTKLNTDTLCKIGLLVGADVPFCIVGGTARVGGIGELVKKLPDMPNCAILIIKHGQKLSTADMYKKIDEIPCDLYATQSVVKSIVDNDLTALCKNVSNTFSKVCQNDELINDINITEPLCVSLSGSGPTVFAIYENIIKAEKAKNKLETMGYSPILSAPSNCGIIIE